VEVALHPTMFYPWQSIETLDPPDGKPIPWRLEDKLTNRLEALVLESHGLCAVLSRFNVPSAIAAVHEMYGAPEWKGGV